MTDQQRVNRNSFRLLLAGQAVSLFGTFMYASAVILFLKDRTNSGTFIGTAQMVEMLPIALLAAFGGTIADRYNRKRIIVGTDLASGFLMLVLSLMAYRSELYSNMAFLVIVALMSVNRLLFGPAILSSVPDLVEPGEAIRANSRLEMVKQIARVAGQPLGAVLYAAFGGAWLFLANGISFILSAISEMGIQLPSKKAVKNVRVSFFTETREGLRHIWHDPGIRALMILNICTNMMFPPFILSLPFFIEDVLGLSRAYYGYFLGAIGLGAVAGSLILSALKFSANRRFGVLLASLGLTAALAPVAAISSSLWILFPAFAVFGGLNIVINIVLNAVLQEQVHGDFRGRVFGIRYSLITMATPLAYLLSGVAIDALDKQVRGIFLVVAALLGGIAIIAASSRNLQRYMAGDVGVEK